MGDSYDNALAETINRLYKAEVFHRKSWRNREQIGTGHAGPVALVQPQAIAGVDRVHPPAEAEAAYYRQQAGEAKVA
ncbi:Transposase [Dokdonella koreensis DS-123]|uniref:Transposase n=1 Tax=Dokdonella koreensis DS-123 TaxID=1300342 RepID=A0A167H497_9GAMM|nr:Transposase [Dokdonella koreensis DS-123]